VLVLGLAVVVGAVPVLARVDVGLQVATTAAQQTSVPLPQGDELGDKELIQSEGEVGPLDQSMGTSGSGSSGGNRSWWGFGNRRCQFWPLQAPTLKTMRKVAFPLFLSGFPAGIAGAAVGYILDAVAFELPSIKYLLICGTGAIVGLFSLRYFTKKFEIMESEKRAE